MKIFINYQFTNALRLAEKRDKIMAIKHMIHGGMEPIKATRFIEAMSQDIHDSWQCEKAVCMQRKSVLKCYESTVLSGFRWYEVL